jgi:hypothetical protein
MTTLTVLFKADRSLMKAFVAIRMSQAVET